MLNGVLAAVRAEAPAAAVRLAGPVSAVHIAGPWPTRAAYALFPPGARVPSVVLKVAGNRPGALRLEAEHAALERIAGIAALAGRVPVPLGLVPFGDAVILAQSGVPGVPMNVILHRRPGLGPRSSSRDHALVTEWIAELRAHGAGGVAAIDAATVSARLEEALPRDVALRREISDRVVSLGRSLGPLRVPLVPVHGDLMPSNCLVSADGLSVIDWERSVPSGSPLAEIVVFLTFYARRLPTRRRRRLMPAAAFRRAFSGEGWLAKVTRATWRRQLEDLGLPVEAAEYLLVATLADLATGHEAAAHPRRAAWRRHWSELLAVYASERVRSSLGTA